MSREARLDEMLACGLIDEETHRREVAHERSHLRAENVKIAKRRGTDALGFAQNQGLLGQQRFADDARAAAMGAFQGRQQGHWVVEAAPKGVERIVEKAVLPAEGLLALALFETDPDVILFLDTVADSWDRHRGATSPDHGARYDRARTIAWERDERGLASRARRRAQDLLRVLEDGTTPTGSADPK